MRWLPRMPATRCSCPVIADVLALIAARMCFSRNRPSRVSNIESARRSPFLRTRLQPGTHHARCDLAQRQLATFEAASGRSLSCPPAGTSSPPCATVSGDLVLRADGPAPPLFRPRSIGLTVIRLPHVRLQQRNSEVGSATARWDLRSPIFFARGSDNCHKAGQGGASATGTPISSNRAGLSGALNWPVLDFGLWIAYRGFLGCYRAREALLRYKGECAGWPCQQ